MAKEYDNDEEEETADIGNIAKQYLQQIVTILDADKTFGLRDKNGKFFIGNKEAR